MEGCRRVLHVSAPMDFQDNEPEAVLTQRSVDGALGIVKSCLRSKTVKRVVHTSSISAMCFNKENVERMDESFWTDVDYVRSELNSYVSSYAISKTETEKAVYRTWIGFGGHHSSHSRRSLHLSKDARLNTRCIGSNLWE
ncbi:hypothetical protein V6Z12_D11G091100 [Gossypium hirsutum]